MPAWWNADIFALGANALKQGMRVQISQRVQTQGRKRRQERWF